MILTNTPSIPAGAIVDICRHVGLPPDDVFAINIAPQYADFHLYVTTPTGGRAHGPDGNPLHHTVRIPITR